MLQIDTRPCTPANQFQDHIQLQRRLGKEVFIPSKPGLLRAFIFYQRQPHHLAGFLGGLNKNVVKLNRCLHM